MTSVTILYKRFSTFLEKEMQQFCTGLIRKWELLTVSIDYSEFPIERQQMAMINNLINFLLLAAMWNNWHWKNSGPINIPKFLQYNCFTSRLQELQTLLMFLNHYIKSCRWYFELFLLIFSYICYKVTYQIAEIFNHFKSEYSITRSHQIISHFISHSNNWYICWTFIVCFEEGPSSLM
jgi:hypothetical protein